MKNKIVRIILSVALCEGVGIFGALFMGDVSSWYTTLPKPALNPPSWVFGPVWTALYALMGIAFYLIWSSPKSKFKNKAFALFGIQLFLNAIWSPIFFGAHSISNALAVIVLLWAAIVMAIFIFKKVSKLAAWLFVPYIIWVSFALYLNLSIWLLANNNSDGVYCTMEAKQCPDGSYVGRTGPKCEFTACPQTSASEFNTPITMRVNEKVIFSDSLSLTLQEINDSRCKPGVQCIWQGELSAVFSANINGSLKEIRLGTVNNTKVSFKNYIFSLENATETSATIIVSY